MTRDLDFPLSPIASHCTSTSIDVATASLRVHGRSVPDLMRRCGEVRLNSSAGSILGGRHGDRRSARQRSALPPFHAHAADWDLLRFDARLHRSRAAW
jgi:hypothetical protein